MVATELAPYAYKEYLAVHGASSVATFKSAKVELNLSLII
jgi:hypothetical protein